MGGGSLGRMYLTGMEGSDRGNERGNGQNTPYMYGKLSEFFKSQMGNILKF